MTKVIEFCDKLAKLHNKKLNLSRAEFTELQANMQAMLETMTPNELVELDGNVRMMSLDRGT